jgi:hypothetical protein
MSASEEKPLFTNEFNTSISDYNPGYPQHGERFYGLDDNDLIGMPGAMMTRKQREEYISSARPGGYFGMGGGVRRRRQTQRRRHRQRKVLKPFRNRTQRRRLRRRVIH